MAKASKTKDEEIDELKEVLRSTTSMSFKKSDLLSTGSTLLNLACSGRPSGGFLKGKYIFLVGDSTSGKTWLSLTCMAEASIAADFKDYVFVYDNVEDGALMDVQHYFGKKMAERLRPPSRDEKGEPVYSTTVESFYYHLDTCIAKARKSGKPFIYVLDSQDSLSSAAADDKFQEKKEAFEKGKETAGSYGDGKAKVHSENIRRVLIGLRETGSILIVIGQTRDNISGFGFEKKTRSGGKSLRFYATLEIWSAVKEKLKKRVAGKDRQVGILAECKVKKNRLTGKDRTVHIPIYQSLGIDDVGANIGYLLEEKHWSSTKGEISAPEFDFEGTEEELIKHVETNELQQDLADLVSEVWNKIESDCAVDRKNRYQ